MDCAFSKRFSVDCVALECHGSSWIVRLTKDSATVPGSDHGDRSQTQSVGSVGSADKERGHKRRRTTSPTEVSKEAGGAKKRRVSSPAAQAYALGAARRRFGRCAGSRSSSSAARVHDPGAASKRKRSRKAGSASTSSGRYRRAFGAAARTGRLSLKKRGRGAPAASE